MKKGWEIKKLINISTVSTGKWNANHSTKNGEYRFYTCAYDYLLCDTQKFKGECLILPGNGVNVGEVFYYDGEFDAYQRTYVISDIKIFPKYLHYHMLLFWKELGTKLQYGSATNFIKIGNFQDYEVQFPKSIKEQQRIVAILDTAFKAIDLAKTNAEQNLKNAKELFESYLQNIFENKDDDWEEKKLGEIANIAYGFTEKSNEKGDFRYIRITDIDKNGELISTGKKYIDISDDGSNFILKENDIVMARTGATFAKLLLYKNIEPSIFASYLIKIDFTEDIMNELYWFFTKTNNYWKQANALSTGTAQPHFNGQALKQIVFMYPQSSDKQRDLITYFRKLQTQTQKLETLYQQKIKNLVELKKSLLQKAFNGEL